MEYVLSTFKIADITYEFTELKDEETQKSLKLAKEITCDCNYFNKRRLVVFQRGNTYCHESQFGAQPYTVNCLVNSLLHIVDY